MKDFDMGRGADPNVDSNVTIVVVVTTTTVTSNVISTIIISMTALASPCLTTCRPCFGTLIWLTLASAKVLSIVS